MYFILDNLINEHCFCINHKVFDYQLDKDTKLVYIYIIFCAGKEHETNINEIAKKCSMKPTTVHYSIQKLLAEKLLLKKEENNYHIQEFKL